MEDYAKGKNRLYGGGEQVAVLMEEDDRGGKSAVNESPRSVDGPYEGL